MTAVNLPFFYCLATQTTSAIWSVLLVSLSPKCFKPNYCILERGLCLIMSSPRVSCLHKHSSTFTAEWVICRTASTCLLPTLCCQYHCTTINQAGGSQMDAWGIWETPGRPQILPCCHLPPPAQQVLPIFLCPNLAFKGVTAKLSLCPWLQ